MLDSPEKFYSCMEEVADVALRMYPTRFDTEFSVTVRQIPIQIGPLHKSDAIAACQVDVD